MRWVARAYTAPVTCQHGLLFFTDVLERGFVLLHIHKASSVHVALNPFVRLGVVGL